jgi:hypothetical protein
MKLLEENKNIKKTNERKGQGCVPTLTKFIIIIIIKRQMTCCLSLFFFEKKTEVSDTCSIDADDMSFFPPNFTTMVVEKSRLITF